MKRASRPRAAAADATPARPRHALLLLAVFFTNLLSLACQVI